MIAVIIGLILITIGLQMLTPRDRPSRQYFIPAGKPAKIFGVLHVACGLLLIAFVTFNTINLYREQQLLRDAHSAQERQTEY